MMRRRFSSIFAATALLATLAGAAPAQAQRQVDDPTDGYSYFDRGWSVTSIWGFIQSLFAADKGQIVP